MSKQKVVGLENCEKCLLRSGRLKDVIDNLEDDQKIVAAFITAARCGGNFQVVPGTPAK